VQFEGVSLNQLPRIYLATPADIARRMRETVERRGEPVLFEQYDWTCRETDLTAIEALPSSWVFSMDRIHELLFPHSTKSLNTPAPRLIAAASLREAVMTA